ncbi:FeoA family protein [Bacillus tianshenii]|nr:FeoA family protein [Bacillus tianshenii]
MRLSDLKHGEKAKITDLSTVSELVKRRLMDLGIMEGSEICLKCRMPFRGPYMLDNCGQCLGIRHQEATSISVERV